MTGWGPFRGIDRPREVFAWGMYDLANQSFQLLINTLLFPIYLSTAIAATKSAGDSAWILFVAAATGLALIVSPLVGAIADARAWKKPLLIGTGLIASALTCLLTFMGTGDVWLAGAVYIAAAFCVGLGENFLGSFLPELAPSEKMGRVSAIGWTMSYIGALLLVGITFLAVDVFKAETPDRWRWMFMVAGVWFFLGMLPAMFMLRERGQAMPAAERSGIVRDMVARLARTTHEVGQFRQLARFLLVFFVYSLGTYTVIFYAAKIGSDTFKFGMRDLSLLALVMAATAGVGAVFSARYQDRIGRLRAVRVFLVVWIISTGALAYMSYAGSNRSWFWGIACGVGLGLGGIGTCSRAVVGAFTPRDRCGEFFGLWGMVVKLAALVGPGSFGLTTKLMGSTGALCLLVGFFVAGLLLLGLINEREGMAAAVRRTSKLCTCCGYDLEGTPVGTDGRRICQECGAIAENSV
jgi:MFS transporter, UMF1 family